MKPVLIFRGGWDGHEPVQTSDVIAAELRRLGKDVEIYDSQECLLQSDLKDKYSVIVPVWTMGELIEGASEALCNAVASGVGLAGWHGGMCDAFRTDCTYQFMCGGQWVAHPGNIIDYRVDIVSDDPIVAGMKSIDMHSEQYYMHVDPGNEVLATTTIGGEHAPWCAGTVMPVIWKRHWNKGRVFYSSLGHVATDFTSHPELIAMMGRGILWAGRDEE